MISLKEPWKNLRTDITFEKDIRVYTIRTYSHEEGTIIFTETREEKK